MSNGDVPSMKPGLHIKAGYVWRYDLHCDRNGGKIKGYGVLREAGLIETLLYRWFGRRPRQ